MYGASMAGTVTGLVLSGPYLFLGGACGTPLFLLFFSDTMEFIVRTSCWAAVGGGAIGAALYKIKHGVDDLLTPLPHKKEEGDEQK